MKPARALGLLLLLVAAGASAAPAGGDDWSALYRPLDLPQLERGALCPVGRVDARVA